MGHKGRLNDQHPGWGLFGQANVGTGAKPEAAGSKNLVALSKYFYVPAGSLTLPDSSFPRSIFLGFPKPSHIRMGRLKYGGKSRPRSWQSPALMAAAWIRMSTSSSFGEGFPPL